MASPFKALVVFAALWGVLAFALAGNWSFNFSAAAEGFRGSPEASIYFWKLTYVTAGLPAGIFVVYGVHALLARVFRRGRADPTETLSDRGAGPGA